MPTTFDSDTRGGCDTRTRYGYTGTASKGVRLSAPQTTADTASLAIFRRLARNLVKSPRHDRVHPRQAVIDHLRRLRQPVRAVNQFLFECVTAGGPDGLDVAIDVLSQTGLVTFQTAREFLAKDLRVRHSTDRSRSTSDDVWYVLLRSLCRSDADLFKKLSLTVTAATRGTTSMREAAVHAIRDLIEANPEIADVARGLLLPMTRDVNSAVRETAGEALQDLEG
jgi:hypothetical protein